GARLLVARGSSRQLRRPRARATSPEGQMVLSRATPSFVLGCGEFVHVSADTRLMDAPSPEHLREELARLEADEKQLSAQRRFLHEQMACGSGSDQTRAREREVSHERRQLHQRIAAPRETLGAQEVA